MTELLSFATGLLFFQDATPATTADIENAVNAIHVDMGMLWMIISGILVLLLINVR